jgi:hypothetical protein
VEEKHRFMDFAFRNAFWRHAVSDVAIFENS